MNNRICQSLCNIRRLQPQLTLYLPCICLLIVLLITPATLSLQAAEPEAPENYTSVEERRLFHTIQLERANIREEKKALALKKKELKSIEDDVDKKLAELDTKLAEMRAMQKKIEKFMAKKSAEEKKKTESLAKIYEKMSPDKAALALSGLDSGLATDLLSVMKAKSAAKILDQISKNKASELSTTFSTIQLE